MLDIPSITGIAAAVGVIVGVVFTIIELRNLINQRQTDLVIRLYSTIGSRSLQEAWEKTRDRPYENFKSYETEYGFREVNQVAMFFEGIGVLLHRKLIAIYLVDDLFTGPAKLQWESLRNLVRDYRKERNLPTIFEYFEYLYNELQKREKTLQAQQ
jgi:hypothetical protein